MQFHLFILVLVGLIYCSAVQADKPGQSLKGRRVVQGHYNEPVVAKFRSNDAELDAPLEESEALAADEAAAVGGASTATNGKKDPSSGRLFLRKFLLFKNLFGSSSSTQPVIPIIITGASPTATATSPTVTVTSTGTIPSATGTITTSPTTPTTSPTSRQYGDDGAEEQEQMAADMAESASAEMVDEQALQAALAAGAQEYEVVSDSIQGTASTDAKAQQSNHISLRRKGSRRGQVISVRVPPRYRRYFKKGQKVMLNTRPTTKRRVVKKKRVNNKNRRRVGGAGKNKNRRNRNKNKNKRTRLTAA